MFITVPYSPIKPYNYIYIIYCLAPGQAILVEANALNGTSIQVMWRAPIEVEQNGMITSYTITFTPINTDIPVYERYFYTADSYPVPDNVSYAQEFAGFEEGVVYNITVSAVNSAGAGLPSEVVEVEMTPNVSKLHAYVII